MISVLVFSVLATTINPEVSEIDGNLGVLYTNKKTQVFLHNTDVYLNGKKATPSKNSIIEIELDPLQSTGYLIKKNKTIICIDAPLTGLGKSGEMQKSRVYTIIDPKIASNFHRFVSKNNTCKELDF